MKVKVYSTPTCPYCKMTKAWLQLKGIEFEDLNVAEDIEARNHMIQRSGQMGVPVTEIGDKVIIGFDEEALEEAVKSLKPDLEKPEEESKDKPEGNDETKPKNPETSEEAENKEDKEKSEK